MRAAARTPLFVPVMADGGRDAVQHVIVEQQALGERIREAKKLLRALQTDLGRLQLQISSLIRPPAQPPAVSTPEPVTSVVCRATSPPSSPELAPI